MPSCEEHFFSPLRSVEPVAQDLPARATYHLHSPTGGEQCTTSTSLDILAMKSVQLSFAPLVSLIMLYVKPSRLLTPCERRREALRVAR